MAHQHPLNPTPEQDADLARDALADGDPRHAAHHIAGALAGDPNREEWLDLLDRILDAAKDPLSLTHNRSNEPVFYGTAAVRAYTLASLEQPAEAVNLLIDVMAAQPRVPYIVWANAWVKHPGAAASIPPARLLTLLGGAMQHFPGVVVPPDDQALLQPYLEFVDAIAAGKPEDGDLLSMRATLLRKMGRVKEAAPVAERAYELKPSWLTAIAHAMSLRAIDDIDGAVKAYLRAASHESSDVSAYLDIGDVLCEAGRAAEGVGYYQKVVDREHRHPWAWPSLCYWRFKLTKDAAWRDRLVAYAQTNPENERAVSLADTAQRGDSPFVAWLPDPAEATTNVLSQIVESKGGITRLTLSALESPSSRAALDAVAGRPVPVDIQAIATPDPRQPCGAVVFSLWTYQGNDPKPAFPAPAPEVADAVSGIAASRYSSASWFEFGRDLGRRLGPARLNDLLGVMLHPPKPAMEVAPWTWRYRVQVAAAFVIAHLDTGWRGSTRGSALISLVRGPLDWTVSAGILALTELALQEPALLDDARGLLFERFAASPEQGGCCYLYPLVCCLLRLPNLKPKDRAELEKWRTGLESE